MREGDLAPLPPDWVVVHTDQWRGVVAVTGIFESREDAEEWLEDTGRPGIAVHVERTKQDWLRATGVGRMGR